MDILNIIPNNVEPFPSSKCLESWITEDRQYLNLSYASLENGCFEQSYNKYFDELDLEEQTYTKVIKLSIETDFINRIPDNVMRFQNLTHLKITGSRFWDLSMDQIPETVRVLYLTEHSNLQPECLKGMDKLINLEEFCVDWHPFGFDNILIDLDYDTVEEVEQDEILFPITNLPKLKKIIFRSGIFYSKQDFKIKWIEILKIHPLFQNIRNRITNVSIENDYELIVIVDL